MEEESMTDMQSEKSTFLLEERSIVGLETSIPIATIGRLATRGIGDAIETTSDLATTIGMIEVLIGTSTRPHRVAVLPDDQIRGTRNTDVVVLWAPLTLPVPLRATAARDHARPRVLRCRGLVNKLPQTRRRTEKRSWQLCRATPPRSTLPGGRIWKRFELRKRRSLPRRRS